MLRRFLIRLIVSSALLLLLWASGFLWFLTQIPYASSSDTRPVDAIVVLTGGKGRIDYGLTLLAGGKAKRMFISGVGPDASPEEVVTQALERMERPTPVSKRAITIGKSAASTIGNALETAQWMRENRYESLRLVTANYHMPRSLKEFTHLLPDVLIIPDPVFPAPFDDAGWWRNENALRFILLEYHKYLAASLRHALIALEDNPE